MVADNDTPIPPEGPTIPDDIFGEIMASFPPKQALEALVKVNAKALSQIAAKHKAEFAIVRSLIVRSLSANGQRVHLVMAVGDLDGLFDKITDLVKRDAEERGGIIDGIPE